MSDFVNYNSRDPQLPPGCTDLLDVLKLTRPAAPQSAQPFSGAQPDGSQMGHLGDIKHYLHWLIGESTKPSFLAIRAGRFQLQLLCETAAGPLDLIPAFPMAESEIGKATREFFVRLGQDPLLDCPSGLGNWHLLRYRLPSVAAPASQVVQDLLREVYGISEYIPLHFVYGRQAGGFW